MAQIGSENIFFYGGMDSDSMLETIAEGNYIKAINCYNSESDVVNKRGKVRKVKSNKLIQNNYRPQTYQNLYGFPKIINGISDKTNNKIYIFITEYYEPNYNGNGLPLPFNNYYLYQTIYEYDTNKKIITNLVAYLQYDEILFDRNSKFLSGKVLGGNLYWTDGLTEPRCINIEKAINYFKAQYQGIYNDNRYYVFNEKITYAISNPPIEPIIAQYDDDSSVIVNYLRGKLFQFRYKYVYNNNKESVWSAISEVPYPYGELLIDGSYDTSVNYNVIKLQINIEQPELRKVVIAVRYTTELETTGKTVWSDFKVVDTIKINNSTNGIDNVTSYLTYNFYNNTFGTVITDEESYKLYDSVPLMANCMEVISSPDRVVYGGCTEGFDNVENVDVTLDIVCNDIEINSGQNSPIIQKQFLLPYGNDNFVNIPLTILNIFGIPMPAGRIAYIPYKYYGAGIIHKIILPNIELQYINLTFSTSRLNSNAFTTSNINVSGMSVLQMKTAIIDAINDAGTLSGEWTTDRAFASWGDVEATNFWGTDNNNPNRGIWYLETDDYKNYFRDNILKVGEDGDNVLYIKSGQIIVDINNNDIFPDTKIKVFYSPNSSSFWFASLDFPSITDRLQQSGLYKLGNKYINNTLNKNDWFDIGNYGYGNNHMVEYKLSNEDWSEYQNKKGIIKITDICGQDISYLIADSGYNIIETLNPFGRYSVGIVYYDNALRCSAVQKAICIGDDNKGHRIDVNNVVHEVIQDDNDIFIPRMWYEYNENLYYNCQMTIRHTAPSWAKYWSPVFTKNKNHDRFFEFNMTDDFIDEYIDTSTPPTIDTSKRTFDINSSIRRWNETFPNAELVEYIYQKGDRIIFYGKEEDDTANRYIDKEILGQQADGKIIVETSIPVDSSLHHNPRIVRIYTPAVSMLDDNYYEVGKMYRVEDGVHFSDTNEQGVDGLTLTIPFGDIFLNVIDYYKKKKGGTSIINAVYNDYFCPFYPSSVNDMGRTHLVNENYKHKKYGSRIRHSNAYIQNSYIDGASAFEPNSYLDLPDKFGEIRYLAELGYTLKALMDTKNISIYIGRDSIVNPDGTEQMILSTAPLGTVAIPVADYGCQYPQSVVVNERYIYFYDVNNACLVRDSSNGMYEISKYLQESFVKDISKKIKENIADGTYFNIYGGYDGKDNLILFAFYDANNVFTQTIVFNENKNLFTHFVDYSNSNHFINGFAYINNSLLTFYRGDIYLEGDGVDYCNFFGNQKDAYIHFVANANPKKLKTYNSISVHATTKWHCGQNGDIFILPSTTYPNGMSSRLKKGKFKDKEGIFYSEFLRDGLSKPVYVDGLINGRKLRGNVLNVILRNDDNDETELFSTSIKFVNSELSF